MCLTQCLKYRRRSAHSLAVGVSNEPFASVPWKVLQMLKRRASKETASEMRDHSNIIRYTYSDYRDELVPMEECERTRADYGEKVGLPVDSAAFVKHLRALLIEAAAQADEIYHDNPYFKMIDGRPKLGRQAKKPSPLGFKQLDEALTRKLDALELSLLDVLADTCSGLHGANTSLR